jgi:hypothetical protein
MLPVVRHSCSGKDNGWQKGPQNLLRYGSCLLPSGNPVDNDDELVAAKPGDKVAFAHASLQPIGHLNQQCVARLVPKRVVDDFEPVEVDE